MCVLLWMHVCGWSLVIFFHILNICIFPSCSLMEIMTPSAQDMHVKLAISALDYSKEGSARVVLSKALTATSEVS